MLYYIRFGADGKSQEISTGPVADDGWMTYESDQPISRLVLANGFIRPMTDEEILAELEELRIKNLSVEIRKKRNSLLVDSDWMVMIDNWNSYTEEKKTSITAYRKALRDLPDQIGFPENIEWPKLL